MAVCLFSTRAQEHVQSCFSNSVQFSAEDCMTSLQNFSSLLCAHLLGFVRKATTASSSSTGASSAMSLPDHMAQVTALLGLQPGAAAQPFLAPPSPLLLKTNTEEMLNKYSPLGGRGWNTG